MTAEAYERYQRTLRKMSPGTIGGQSKVATPVSSSLSDSLSTPTTASSSATGGSVPGSSVSVPPGALIPSGAFGSGIGAGPYTMTIDPHGYNLILLRVDVAPIVPSGWTLTVTLGPTPDGYSLYVMEAPGDGVNNTMTFSLVSTHGPQSELTSVFTKDTLCVQRASGSLSGTTSVSNNFDRTDLYQPSTFVHHILYETTFGTPDPPTDWAYMPITAAHAGMYYIAGDPPAVTFNRSLPTQQFYGWVMHEFVTPY